MAYTMFLTSFLTTHNLGFLEIREYQQNLETS